VTHPFFLSFASTALPLLGKIPGPQLALSGAFPDLAGPFQEIAKKRDTAIGHLRFLDTQGGARV